MNILKTFERELSKMKERKWEYIYVLVDIYDTIFKGCYHDEEKYKFFPYALETLKLLSDFSAFKLILWSSTYEDKLIEYIHKFNTEAIFIDYINSSPEKNSVLSCFDKKFYFNIGIDDKFGFEPEKDWEIIYNYLNSKINENYFRIKDYR